MNELSSAPSTARGRLLVEMWMYLGLGVGILVAFNVLIVVTVSALARQAEPRDERDELDSELRERLLSHVRAL